MAAVVRCPLYTKPHLGAESNVKALSVYIPSTSQLSSADLKCIQQRLEVTVCGKMYTFWKSGTFDIHVRITCILEM